MGTWAPAWWYVCANPLEVVLADLGCAELVWPEERLLWKPRPSDQAVPICTVQYRAPDMLLGSQRFGPDLDLWSLGCVAAELFLREPLFQPKRPAQGKELLERDVLNLHFAFLGAPHRDSRTHAWMKSLPFVETFYGKGARQLPADAALESPPERLRGCPAQLTDFVQQTLRWHPEERPTAASASLHSFVGSRPLSVTASL